MMKKPVRAVLLCVILFCAIAVTAFAADFGLILGTEREYTDDLSPDGFSLRSTARPWVSVIFTETINLYLSGKMTFEYEEKEEPPQSYLFEPERTELTLRPASALYLSLGRQNFRDPAGLIVSGLLDGAAFSLKLGPSRLSLGAWYTGLLYKETAKILLTPGDR